MEDFLSFMGGDAESVKEGLRRVHREKSFELGEADYTGRIDMSKVARLHAYHIALLSRLERPNVAYGLTELDLRLASAFAAAASVCGRVEDRQEDEFFRLVVNFLNELIERLCGGTSGAGGQGGPAQQGEA